MMTEQQQNGESDLWPTLNEAHGIAKPSSPRVTWHEEFAASADGAENDWEIVGEQGFEVQDEEEEEKHVVVLRSNPKLLRHCASSPDLRYLDHSGDGLEAVDEEEEGDHESLQVDDDSTSHVLVSAPPSVVSMASTASKATIKRIPSFRDAILAKQEAEKEQQNADKEGITPIKRSQKKVRPKIVVTPIKRCSRSTGDLQALAEEEEVLGETDAMEYYNRKSMGASGRVNAQKERPDEAKRKEIIMYKKELQRQKQSARSRG